MDPDPASYLTLSFITLAFTANMPAAIGLLIILIICSAMVSGSEIAFFGLNHKDVHYLQDQNDRISKTILNLQDQPKQLLATILICNNFINIAIVIVSNFLISAWLGDETLMVIGNFLHGFIQFADPTTLAKAFNFFVTVVGVTFLLVLFGEVAPKVYASVNNMRFARLMALPLSLLNKLCSPLSGILVGWSTSLESRISPNTNSQTIKEDIDKAIELTVSSGSNAEEEADILKGILKFGDVPAKQIMKSRVDVVAIDKESTYGEVLKTVIDSGYSRIPVFEEDFDNVVGILYAKDLLGFEADPKSFDWHILIRDGLLYIPESKKIDDLLREFQQKKKHLGIVVDEYGGSSGIITLEDVMEEVVGDIKDEFDDEGDIEYVMLDEYNYIFEGKSLINDMCRVVGLDTDYFDTIRGNSDTIAGLLLEVFGVIPKPERKYSFNKVGFRIVSVSNRRIEKVHVRLQPTLVKA